MQGLEIGVRGQLVRVGTNVLHPVRRSELAASRCQPMAAHSEDRAMECDVGLSKVPCVSGVPASLPLAEKEP